MSRPRDARASNADEQPSGGSRKRDATLAAVGDPEFEVETRAQRASRRRGAEHDEALRVAETLNDLEAALKLDANGRARPLSRDTRAGMRALVATLLGGGDDAQAALVRLVQEGVRVERERLTQLQECLTREQREEIQRLEDQVKRLKEVGGKSESGVTVVNKRVYCKKKGCRCRRP